ncbi:Spermidine hydroxycinnamoyl transferase [Vitis vinifera]|uniref:Spermidine hydroxycinnamoyl transferase n=1 Tax=Vitis vinifera TaxID=29760 RepID=A0A438IHC1_VITVI|nr:Spermidine hydroxycinnamoyl transferase [Vitis vinifera]
MVKLMATYTVRPAKETPGGYRCLSDSDQVRALTHAPTIYFYPPVNVSLESATEILRHSLIESEAKIDDFGDFRPTQEIRLSSLQWITTSQSMNYHCFWVQVTKFSCGGMSLGLGISHTIADGLSALHFISEWAKIARGEQPNSPPFLDRSVLLAPEHLSAPVFDHPEYSTQPLLIGKQETWKSGREKPLHSC